MPNPLIGLNLLHQKEKMQPKDFSAEYSEKFKTAFENIEAGNQGSTLNYSDAVTEALRFILAAQDKNAKVLMIGNGGSAGIASHMAVDYWKNGNIRSTAFNDASLLTCVSNDYSYEEVFSKPIEMFADVGDVLFAVSSSGSSKNILNGVQAAIDKGCKVVTFSGFNPDNPLRTMGDVNFYVPAFSYGFVEILHNLIIHEILDTKLHLIDKKDVFYKNQDVK